MKTVPCVTGFLILLSLGLMPAHLSAQVQMTEAEGVEFFESRIRPVLIRECYGCHSEQAGQARGGLKLDTKQGLLLGGDSGPSLTPGDLEESPLWSAINYEDYAMPPNKMMSADIIEDFRIWIEAGAPDPRSAEANVAISATVTDEDISHARKEFWAFQHPRKPALPQAADSDWAQGPIDQFIKQKLDEQSLSPAADAEGHVLLRRLCFDLIGLPPTPEQIQWFEEKWAIDQEQAVSMTVDRLLNSPRFGERWGRHWLDVARYAESSGKELNSTFPYAWRYRDYVIDSFNEDKPYDRFVQEQLAGDLLPVKRNDDWSENLIATGFLAMGPKTLTEQNPRQFRADLIDEQIDVSTRVVLGISVACARCHDHKFDPIPQSDYYAMAGIFGSTDTYYGTLVTRQNRRASDLILLPSEDEQSVEKPLSTAEREGIEEQIQGLRDRIRELAQERRQAGDSDATRAIARRTRALSNQISSLQTVLQSFDEEGVPKSFCMGVQPAAQPTDASLLVRGEVDQPAQKVPRGFVQVIGGKKSNIRSNSTGRLELARWMTDESNPLTARVMVNRIWQHLMGQGLVTTTENFGATGMPPTHPELLDYLAVQFMDYDWSIKQMIREIATSRSYRMSTTFNAEYYEKDPDNKLLWRATPRRLEAEAIRDAMLSLSGKLETNRPAASEVARGGTTIVRNGQLRNIRETASRGRDLAQGDLRRRRGAGRRTPTASADPLAYYRSIYLPVVRDSFPRALAVFDFAESSMVVGVRETSNTPDQGLYFLNNETVIQMSRDFADRLLELTPDRTQRIEYAFLLAYGRAPTETEMQASLDFLDQFDPVGSARDRQQQLARWTVMCQSIMAAAEFRIVN